MVQCARFLCTWVLRRVKAPKIQKVQIPNNPQLQGEPVGLLVMMVVMQLGRRQEGQVVASVVEDADDENHG